MYVHQFVFEIGPAENESYQLYNSRSDYEKLIRKEITVDSFLINPLGL